MYASMAIRCTFSVPMPSNNMEDHKGSTANVLLWVCVIMY